MSISTYRVSGECTEEECVHTYVWVRGDDRTASEIDPLAHHVLPEEAFLLLQLLPDTLSGHQPGYSSHCPQSLVTKAQLRV